VRPPLDPVQCSLYKRSHNKYQGTKDQILMMLAQPPSCKRQVLPARENCQQVMENCNANRTTPTSVHPYPVLCSTLPPPLTQKRECSSTGLESRGPQLLLPATLTQQHLSCASQVGRSSPAACMTGKCQRSTNGNPRKKSTNCFEIHPMASTGHPSFA
jgi:hypothetical protein